MALILLGLRLTVAGGRTGRLRAAMAVIGPAVGTFVLLLAVGVARLVPRPESPRPGDLSYRTFQLVILLFVSAAVIVLLATVSRLSAVTRDRRLAGLRLLGTTARATRTVAAVEAAVLALLGSALGVPVFLLLRGPLQGTSVAGVPRIGDQLHPGWFPVLVIFAAVPLLAVVVSLAPTRRVNAAPLQVRRGSAPGRPRLWRLVPVCIGLALLTYAAIRAYNSNGPNLELWWLIGAPLTAAGLPLAIPVAVRLVADLLALRARAPWLRLAGRRLQLEPAAPTRVIAALITGLMLVIAAQSVLASFERVPQYRHAIQSETTGPQDLEVSTTRPFARADLLAVQGVRTAIPRRSALYAPGTCAAAEHACVSAYLGTCADLLVIMPGVGYCSDDAVALLGSKVRPPPGPIKLVAWGPGGQDVGEQIPFSVTATQRWPLDEEKNIKRDEFGGGSSEVYHLFVPVGNTAWPADAAFPEAWSVTAAGGAAVRHALEETLQARDPGATVFTGVDFAALEQVPRLRAILWAATWVVLLIGFLALALAAADRAAERRRGVVGLHALGVPAAVVRRSHLVQALVPVAVGVPLAGALGLLAGRGYLQVIGEAAYQPVRLALLVTVMALGIGVVLSLATLPVVGRRISAEHLRRE